ncbi:MAG: SRPBCC family protein, partial [Thermoleophilaceae bacterium]|nr:SRPBCC family protein [Thermoleophilaceae bacterium]
MGKVTTSIDIDASPEDVWAAVTDLPRLRDWVTIHGRPRASRRTSASSGRARARPARRPGPSIASPSTTAEPASTTRTSSSCRAERWAGSPAGRWTRG